MTTATSIDRDVVAGILNDHLATASDLVSQLKQAHWQVRGESFIALHELFDREADLVRGYVDEYAERIRALERTALGTVRQAAEASQLDEFPAGQSRAEDVVQTLLQRFERYSQMLGEAIQESEDAGDLTTQDLFIEVQREIDRHAWFLRSHLD